MAWRVVLDGVGCIRIRAIRPDDATQLVAMHGRLSPETVYLRFFSPHPPLSAREVHRFTHVDGQSRLALIAVLDERIIGVVRCDRSPTRADEAEVAIVVEDAYQHHGIGLALLRRLTEVARARGITRLSAQTLPVNRPVLELFHRAGYRRAGGFADVIRLECEIAGGANEMMTLVPTA